MGGQVSRQEPTNVIEQEYQTARLAIENARDEKLKILKAEYDAETEKLKEEDAKNNLNEKSYYEAFFVAEAAFATGEEGYSDVQRRLNAEIRKLKYEADAKKRAEYAAYEAHDRAMRDAYSWERNMRERKYQDEVNMVSSAVAAMIEDLRSLYVSKGMSADFY